MTTEQRNLKVYLTFPEQLALLRQRGLAISEDPSALHTLERLGYYRLSGYFYPLRKTKPVGQVGRLDDFVDGASLELVVQLADFDKKLRLLVLHAIETVEVSVRVAVAYRLGRLHPEAHLNGRYLDGRFAKRDPSRPHELSGHEEWTARFLKACETSKEEFVVHHQREYGGRIPLWACIEVWDFGLLSKFFAGMAIRDQAAIAARYGLSDGAILKSWLRVLNFTRNVAAHHSRLWNRSFPLTPVLPAPERCRWLEVLHKNERSKTKLFGTLTCLRHLIRSIDPGSTWHAAVKAHVANFPASPLVSLDAAGFVEGWEDLPVWS